MLKSRGFLFAMGIAGLAGSCWAGGNSSPRIEQYVSQFGTSGTGDGQFNHPYGVVVDGSGNVYVADTDNHRIQKFDSSGAYSSQWGGYGDVDGLFAYPADLALDGANSVYVADSNNHRIQKFDSSGTYVSQFGSQGSANGQFFGPTGVDVDDSDNLYVVDMNNNRVQKFDSSGAYVTKWGSFGTGDGQFQYPASVAVDGSGNVYVADTDNHRVQKFDSSGVYLAQWGTAFLGSVRGIAVDAWGNVYVSDFDYHRIQGFDSSGTDIGPWGTFGSGDGQFSTPFGIAVDGSGNVYVADKDNHRVQKFMGAEILVAISEDGSPTAFSLTLNATDINSFDTLTWSILTPAAHGTASASGTGTAKAIDYTPTADYNGEDSFVVQVSDGVGGTDTITVHVAIGAVNDVPEITEGESTPVMMSEDGSPTAFSLTLNATDAESDTLTWSISTLASHGTATASGTGASKEIGYTPTADYNGADSFVVQVSDGNGGTDTITVDVTIDAVNDASPIITEGATAPVTMSEDGSPTAFALTLNATDADLDTLTWSVSTPAGNGTATASGTGTSKAIGYTPTANYNGADSFVVQVSDGNGGTDTVTVDVTVNAVNDAPTITEGTSTPVTMSEDGSPTPFALTLNATDTEDSTLTWSISAPAAHGTATASGTGTSKSIGYTPATNYNGADSFVVEVSDGNSGTDTITVNVTISAVNDAPPSITQGASTPVTMSEDGSPTAFALTLNATDADLDTLTWSVSTPAAHGAAAASGTGTSKAIGYAPVANYNGADSFAVQVSDGNGGTDTITVNVTITAVNGTAAEVWVDFTYTSTELGTESQPFNTMFEGVLSAANGAQIHVASGDSPEKLTLSRPTTLTRSSATGVVRIGVAAVPRPAASSSFSIDGEDAETTDGTTPDRVPDDGGLLFRQFTGADPDSGNFEGIEVFEPVMPYTALADGSRLLAPDDILAVRLRGDSPLDPESVWGEISSVYRDSVDVQWVGVDDAGTDLWILFYPIGSWLADSDEPLDAAAGGADFEGNDVQSESFRFHAVSQARETADAVRQPEADEGPRISVTAATSIRPLDGGIGGPMAIGPEEVYEGPQWVWLALPAGVGTGETQLWYYKTAGDDAGWYPSGAVTGFLEPGAIALYREAGIEYVGVRVKHGGIIALRRVE